MFRLSGHFPRRSRPGGRPRALPCQQEAGSAIVYVMLTVGVLSVVAASLLLTNVSRYQTAFQSASWQESIVGAEAGVDLAMNELRKRVISGSPAAFSTAAWTTTNPQTGKVYGSYGRSFSNGNQAYQIASHGGEGNQNMQVRVLVDVPGSDTGSNFAQPDDTSFISQIDNPKLRDQDGVDRSRWLFRIRSLGVANLTGPPRPNLNKLDNRLRHFSFFNDWRTGRSVSAPQVNRLVEAVTRPQTGFRNALMADSTINLSGLDVLIDSYDSSKGVYNATTNHGQMGNLATNGQLINANKAVVNGNAMTNNGTVNGGQNVTGQQSSTFYQELTPLTTDALNPAWSGVNDDGTITTTPVKPYVASASSSSPTLVRLDGVSLSNGNTLSINAPANGSTSTAPSYIKVYVQGDLATNGASQIVLAPNVNAIFYVSGNVNLQGSGIINTTQLARNLVVNGIQPPVNADGSYPARSINVATTQDFEGIIYAPNHDLNLALQAVNGGSSGGGGNTGTVVVSLTGSNPLISSYQAVLTQAANTGYQIQLDQQAQQALYNQTSSPAALQKVQQDQVLYNQQLAIWNTNKTAVEGLGGTVSTSMSTVSDSSAADHALGYNGIYGGFIGKTITVAAKTHVHYDETLRTAGPVNHYEIVNWFEDNLSHDATGGTELFWW